MNGARQLASKIFGGKVSVSATALRKWNLAAAVILAGQGVAILLLGGAYSLPVYISYTTRDSLQSSLHNASITAPAIHELTQINLTYMAAAMLLVSAVIYILIATFWRQRYEARLKKQQHPLRWVLTAVVGGLAIVTTALLAGVQNADTLKLLALLAILASMTIQILELSPIRGKVSLQETLLLLVGISTGFVPWLIILMSLVATNIFDGGVPTYLWWLWGSALLGWVLFVSNAHLYRFRVGKWANYAYAEMWSTGLILVVETVFTWQLFVAVLRP